MAEVKIKTSGDYEAFVRYRQEVQRLEAALRSLNAAGDLKGVAKMEQRLRDLRGKFNGIVNAAAQTQQALADKLGRSINQTSQEIQTLTARLKTMQGQMGASRSAIAGVAAELERKRIAMGKQSEEYKKLGITQKETMTQTESFEKSLLSAGAKFAAGLGVANFVNDIVSTRASFQDMEAQITTMVGRDKAGDLMAQLQQLAKVSPLAMQDMIAAEKMMVSFGLDADKSIKYIKALSDVSAGDSAKFNSLTLAFSQMSAAGKLMGQDLMQIDYCLSA